VSIAIICICLSAA